MPAAPSRLMGVRYMQTDDLPTILKLEKRAFGASAWNHDDFMACFKSDCMNGVVGLLDDELVGYALAKIDNNRTILWQCVVDPKHRRRRIGSGLVEYLEGLAHLNPKWYAYCREHQLGAQQWFREMGWTAVRCEHEYFINPPEDAIVFRHIVSR